MADQMRQLAAQLATVEALVKQKAADVVAAHAKQVAEDARALAPVDTGRLRDSIEVVQTDELHYAVVATAPYAADVELGTVHQAAEPFLFPAAEASKADLKEKLQAALKNA